MNGVQESVLDSNLNLGRAEADANSWTRVASPRCSSANRASARSPVRPSLKTLHRTSSLQSASVFGSWRRSTCRDPDEPRFVEGFPRR